MFGDSRTTGMKVSGDLTDCQPVVTQESKDLSASGISYSAEHRIRSFTLNCNHMVTKIVTEQLPMSSGARLRTMKRLAATESREDADMQRGLARKNHPLEIPGGEYLVHLGQPTAWSLCGFAQCSFQLGLIFVRKRRL